MNRHRFDISYTLCPIYISYGQLKTNSESATLRMAWSLNGSIVSLLPMVAAQSSVQLHGSGFEFCSRLFVFQFSMQLL